MDVDNAAVGIPQSGAPTPDKYKNRVLTISMHEEVLGLVEVDVKTLDRGGKCKRDRSR